MTEEEAPYGNTTQESPTEGKPTQDDPAQNTPTEGAGQGSLLGEILGRALLASFAKNAAGEPMEGEDTPDVLCNKARQALEGLPPENLEIFNKYNSIIPATVLLRDNAQTTEARLLLAVERLNALINNTVSGELFYYYLRKLPAYMTGKEFLDAQDVGREEYFTQDSKDLSQGVYDLIVEATEYYVARLDSAPGKDNPLSSVKTEYTGKKVTSKLILDTWHSVHSNGYYVRANGKKSGITTKAEFDRLVREEEEGDAEDVIKTYTGRGDYIAFDKAVTEDPDGIRTATWHEATGQPKNLTKWDAVKDLGLIYDNQEDLADLKNEFPELLERITTQLKTAYDIDVGNVAIEDWKKPYISRRQLYRINFCNQRKTADNYYRRKFKNGVAVAADTWNSKEDLYKELGLEAYKEQTLEAYIRGYPFYGSRRSQIETHKAELKGYYYFLLGYNYLIEKTAELRSVPSFRGLKINLEKVESNARALIYMVGLLHKTILALPHDELRLNKLEVLKNFFLIPPLDSVEIPLANKKRADRMLKDFTGYTVLSRLVSLLMEIPAEEGR